MWVGTQTHRDTHIHTSGTDMHQNTPDKSFKVLIVLTLSCCVLYWLLQVLTFPHVRFFFILVCVCLIPDRATDYKTQRQVETLISGVMQMSAVGPKSRQWQSKHKHSDHITHTLIWVLMTHKRKVKVSVQQIRACRAPTAGFWRHPFFPSTGFIPSCAKINIQDSFAAINLPWWKGPVETEADVEEVAMVTTAEGRAFPEEVRDLRPPLCPTVWPPPAFFLFFTSGTDFAESTAKPSLELLPESVDDTSWKLALVKRAVPSSSRFCEEAGREVTPPPELLLL